MAFFKKVVGAAAAAVASYYAAKLVQELLEERSLGDRYDDMKGKATDIKDGLSEKADAWRGQAREKYTDVMEKLDELAARKKDSEE